MFPRAFFSFESPILPRSNTENPTELFGHLDVREFFGPGLGNENNLAAGSDFRTVQAKELSDATLYMISGDGVSDLAANCNSDSCPLEARPIQRDYDKMSTVPIAPAGLCHEKLAPLADAQLFAKAITGRMVRCRTRPLKTWAARPLRGSSHSDQRRAGF